MNLLELIVMIVVMIGFSFTEIQPSKEKSPRCLGQATIACCKGFVLTVLNETTANCVECLPPGKDCYKTDQSCCPGYRCGSGGAVYPEPRPGDRCISDQIIG